MAFLHHWDDEHELSYEELRDNYIKAVENDAMASLNEIRNVHDDDDYLSAKEFCEKYNLN